MNPETITIVCIFVCALIIVLCLWIISLRKQKEQLILQEQSNLQLKEQLQQLQSQYKALCLEQADLNTAKIKLSMEKEQMETQFNKVEHHCNQLQQERSNNQSIILELHKENASLLASNDGLIEKLQFQKEEMETIQKQAHLQFERLAQEILEEKSQKFSLINQEKIQHLLQPLSEHLQSFKTKVEETYNKESRERFSLEARVKELVEQTNKVSQEANNLANALKTQVKQQGNWGEMILESVLQQAGLVANREYFLQETFKNNDGQVIRPDIIVKLPHDRHIIIDAKVSLTAYDRFQQSELPAEQQNHLGEHIKSIRRHIDQLQAKNYDDNKNSLNFTMMFVPIEPAYLLAIQEDANLWQYAYNQRILLISPTNLIACLKLMNDLWKKDQLSKNAEAIIDRAEKMYEKFVTFTENMLKVGNHLDQAQKVHDQALKQLHSGHGNLVTQAQKLKALGLKSNKTIASDLDTEVGEIQLENTKLSGTTE